MEDALAELNPPQRDAVLHGDGPLLVLAGAGSGKTRVITRRIAFLVTSRNVPPWRILAVTFTNKAAREMRERLQKQLGTAGQGLTVSTFHAAAAMILRREAESVGLNKSFVIYDDNDQMSLMRRALKEIGGDVSNVTPREMLSRVDREKNSGRLPHQMRVGAQDPRGQIAQRAYKQYQKLLHAANAVDFGDLLLLLVELLRTNEETRLHYQRRFQHILVDEFQDTNPVQYELLKLLAPPPKSNVVVVGDDDQSIYRWRGADVDNILGFPREYPGAAVVKLEQNYRSDQTILEAAHAVISNNRKRMPKKLWSARAKGESLSLLLARDERDEAQQVAAKIHELRRQGICDYDQCATFFRTNAQSRILEETFRLNRVPYVLVSGRSFYERAEIKDAASYLRLMANPKSDADVLRVINTPSRGIGDTTVERVTEYASGAGLSVYEAIEVPERIESLNSGAVRKLRSFRELIDRLVTFAKTEPDAARACEVMLDQTGMVTVYNTEGTDESFGRAENLKELVTAAQEFDRQRAERIGATTALGEVKEPATSKPTLDSTPGAQGLLFGDPVKAENTEVPLEDIRSLEVEASPLEAFLEQISLVGEADGDTGEDQNRVSLMTLHSAKGLEFDAVFVTGMEEEIFPHRRSLGPEATEDDMAEERRLCYVGFTRARRRLFCSFAQSRALFGEFKFYQPSRFLSEVPKALFGEGDDPLNAPSRSQVSARPAFVRRRGPDEGPVIDRTYDQSTDFHHDQHSGDVKGIRVSHSQFGPGVVLEVNGRGPNAKLTVRFERVGVKTVVARFLTPS